MAPRIERNIFGDPSSDEQENRTVRDERPRFSESQWREINFQAAEKSMMLFRNTVKAQLERAAEEPRLYRED